MRNRTVWLPVLAVALAAASSALAAEYRGVVKAAGLPVPGASVTAVQSPKREPEPAPAPDQPLAPVTRVTTATDDQGAFRFTNLPDGEWTIEVEMLGFASITRQVTLKAGVPAAEFQLEFLTRETLAASFQKTPPRPSDSPRAAARAQPGAVPSTAPNNATTAADKTGRSGAAAEPGAASPGSTATAPAQQQARRNPSNRRGRTTEGARPGPANENGFQRVEVNQRSETEAFAAEGAIRSEEAAELSQNAANAFIVQGSMSSALALPQLNDWGPPGGSGAGLPGGPGIPGMRPFPGAEGMQGADGPPAGGPGGRGPMMRPGGGPAGRMGPGGPGGFPGQGGRGGFGGAGGRPGASRRAGAAPGGRPNWQGRRNAMAFGNNRRDPRNSYMGVASFSLNNSALDARTFSVTGAAVDKPAYANARGNLMFGGPLRIPRLVSASNQIHFMVNFQFQRNRTGIVSEPTNVPTALERAGDFSQTRLQGKPITLYDPLAGTPFDGNKIPEARLNAAAIGLLKYYPQPNLNSGIRNYQTSWNGVNNSHHVNARLSNIRLGAKDRLNFAMGYRGSSTVAPNLFRFIDTGAGRSMNVNLSWSRNITTRLINSVQYTFSRSRQLALPYFASTENVAAALGIAGTSQDPDNWGPPNLSFTNYADLRDGNYSLARNQTSSASESLLWVRGRHTFTFGGEYRRQQFNQLADNNGRGTLSFTGAATSYTVNGVAQNGTGYDLADFLLGLPATSSIRYGNADKYFRAPGFSLFFNDDWRPGRRITINAGLRWDYWAPFSELHDRLVNLDIAPGFTAVAAALPGQTLPYSGLVPDALIRPDHNNFSPRFGLAWRPQARRSLVVRGGYGLYYNTSVYNVIAGNMAQQPPFARNLSVSASAANPLLIADAFHLASPDAATGTYAIDPNYRIGYAQSWMVTIQHDLPFDMFATAGYLGTKGTRLDQQFLPNSVPPGAPESVFPHNFIYQSSNGNSIYHAAQFQLNRRFRSGFSAQTSYQFSKSIDNAGTGGRGQGGTPIAQNWLDLAAERALSSFDSRHNLSVRLLYSTAMGTSGGAMLQGWRGALVKDWTVSAMIHVRSGTPLTATVGGNRSQVGGTAVTGTVRADATGLPVDAPGMLFNTGAFAAPAAGRWGTAGRNTIPGPAVFSLDGSAGRTFRLGERRTVDLQLQAQNVLNRVTITRWGTVFGSNNYGLATTAADMRRITANLRLRF